MQGTCCPFSEKINIVFFFIPSVLRRKYRVDEIPVFGLLRIRPFIILKAMAYDFNKIRNYNRRSRDKSALLPAIV